MPPRKQKDETNAAETAAMIQGADAAGNPGAVLTGDAMHGETVLVATADGGAELGTHESPEGVDHKVKVYDPAKGEVAPAEELPGTTRVTRASARVARRDA